jgi:hypothetical protein
MREDGDRVRLTHTMSLHMLSEHGSGYQDAYITLSATLPYIGENML